MTSPKASFTQSPIVTAALLLAALAVQTSRLVGQTAPLVGDEDSSRPIRDGLQALYEFRSGAGEVVRDLSGVSPSLDLRIDDVDAVRWTSDGLEVVGPTVIQSTSANRLTEAVRTSGELSIVAWVRPARLDQSGPARIVTLSQDSSRRNVTLGQDGDRLEIRLRTTHTSVNGIPATSSPQSSLSARPMHVVYTRASDGVAALYLDGRPATRKQIAGETSNWDDAARLVLANEATGDRPWLGTFRRIAVYDRALSSAEIRRDHRAATGEPTPLAEQGAGAEFFETRIAPLLAANCLECHDAGSQEGGLDLSVEANALTGGDSGPAIDADEPLASLLWELVESDEMPRDRTPLSDDEKQTIRSWLAQGATWSLARIDPAVYVHGAAPTHVFVKRLTVPEYIETVRATLGIDVAAEARAKLPRDVRADGFSNTAYNLNVDFAHVEAYAELAAVVVERLDLKRLARRHTKSQELTDENLTKIIEPVGKRLLRRPLNPEEIAGYCGVSTSVAGAGGTFDEALGAILETMLQSPRFLYRIENQRGDGAAWPIGDYELASRLSYMIWGGPPDEDLLQAADDGRLHGDGVAVQVERMLDDPRAIAQSRRFVSEWLNLDRLESLRPDPARFPDWNPNLAEDMRRETLAFFEQIAWTERRPLTDLLNARVAFLTPALARHYGLSPATGSGEKELVRYDLTDVAGRAGLLTQGSVLTIGGDDASTVARGLFVMHELLRGVVRDPPPGVDTTPIPPRPGLTRRAIAETRIADASCSGCHSKFEPLSFALERFDGLGAYAESDEYGNALRQDGVIRFPGRAESVAYDSTIEMLDLLAADDRVRESLTWKVAQFSLGRPLGASDAATIQQVHRTAWEQGGTYADLLAALAVSDLVRTIRTEERPMQTAQSPTETMP